MFICHWMNYIFPLMTQIARFMGPTWGPPGSCRPQMGPIMSPWTLLSGNAFQHTYITHRCSCVMVFQPKIHHGMDLWHVLILNILRPRQNGRLFADDTFKRIFLNENIIISIKISLKFVPKGLIDNIPALVLIMAWCQAGNKPLSEPMMVTSLTHIFITRPRWINEH